MPLICCHCSRARKIRCDSTRPTCHNCTRRGNECEYDAVPKRRGPDKRPGTRQRSCKKRPSEADASGAVAKKKRKTEGNGDGSVIAFDVRPAITNNEERGFLSSPSAPPNAGEGSALLLTRSPPQVLDTSRNEIIYPKVSRPARLVYCGFNEYLFSASRWNLHPYRPRDSTLWIQPLNTHLSLLHLHTLVFLGGTNYCRPMLPLHLYHRKRPVLLFLS